MSIAIVSCGDRTPREVNRDIRRCLAEGSDEILVQEPAGQHNLGVGLVQPVTLHCDGSVGYYCGGLIDGPTIHIAGSAGWGVAEGMMSGMVIVEGDAGNGAGAAVRGGTLIIKGDAGTRAGVGIKGGTILIGGSCGYMTGFMGQKGRIIVCGDADEALGDSMYETVIYVGGRIAELGNDAVVEELASEEQVDLNALVSEYGLPVQSDWQKVVSGRKLWNFDRHESAWRSII